MLVGSRALAVHFPDFKREPKDWDWITDIADYTERDANNDAYWHPSFPQEWANNAIIASPEFMYTLKVSHAAWDIHGTWEKHMSDVLFLQRKGLDASFDRETYDILFPVWKELHGKKRVNLNKTKDDFFGDAVVRKYDHDSLHDSVAYGDRPMYERILRDGSEVMVDSDKFWAMDFDDKMRTIREEIYATALERWVVPSNYKVSPRAAYARALKKSIVSLFKNDWCLFIVRNYDQLYQPDMDYVKHHQSKSHKLILL